MSLVTNYIVTLRNILDLEITPRPTEVEIEVFFISMFQEHLNEFAKREGGTPPRLFSLSDAHANAREYGPKFMEADVWIGASNYFNGSQFVRAIECKPVYQKHLKVFAEEQEEEEFKQIWPGPVVLIQV